MKQLFKYNEPTSFFFEDHITNEQISNWIDEQANDIFRNPLGLNTSIDARVNLAFNTIIVSTDDDYVEYEIKQIMPINPINDGVNDNSKDNDDWTKDYKGDIDLIM